MPSLDEMFLPQISLNKSTFYCLVVDWYPGHIEVRQKGTAINVTFNLAPPELGISSYFSQCYANGIMTHVDITPVSGLGFVFCCFVFSQRINSRSC